ncbi:MAG TPA: methylated-DNA--[protein]-cysteine S-methyltransferase [Planctomycetes bacterium]|nr:methylated-DNA--[protein]-cysteine S-methyltransferase [Planctomycetota bacterium]
MTIGFYHRQHRLGDLLFGIGSAFTGNTLLATSLQSEPRKARGDIARLLGSSLSARTTGLSSFEEEIDRYLRGEPVRWQTPFDLPHSTDFQRQLWLALSRVPTGKTVTYGEIAMKSGSPRGARAAGQACGKNPLPLRIPCHRVVSADGRIGGFTGDLEVKRALLRLEGVHLP